MINDLARQIEKLHQNQGSVLSVLMDAIPDCIYIKDAAGRYLLDNLADRKLLGAESFADVSGKSVFDFFPKDIAQRFFDDDLEVLKSGKPLLNREEPYATQSGEQRWFSTTKTPLHAPNGEIIGVVGISRDITRRKRAQNELGVIQRLLQRLSGPITEADLGHEVAAACRKLFGHDAFVLQLFREGTTVHTLYAEDTAEGAAQPAPIEILPDHRTPLGTELMQSAAGRLVNQPDDKAFAALAVSSKRISKSLMYVPICWEQQVIGILTAQSYTANRYAQPDLVLLQSMADMCGGALARVRIEERLKQSEEHARQSQKLEAIGGLAGGIAHDFNNLLTVIRGRSDLLLGKIDTQHPFYRSMEEIRRTSERAADLTQKLLAFSRRQMFQMRVLDLNAVTADMEKLLQRLIGEDVELVAVPGENLGGVRADPAQLEQVILNLAVNARDAMPGGGKLTLETANVDLDKTYAATRFPAQPGPYVMLAVSDTGTGMDKEIQSRIFEPFFTTKPKGKGTGLGLSTVYGIVKQTGGYIWVYSELGKGTTFKIYLPRIVEPFDPTRTSVVRKLPKGSETILLVEDEENVRALVGEALEESGYTVIVARTPYEAIGICESHKPRIDLMLTDVVMPGLNGRELAERVSPLRPEMKVLYMSGYSDNAVILHGILARDLAFLQKPFTLDALNRKVRKVLGDKAT